MSQIDPTATSSVLEELVAGLEAGFVGFALHPPASAEYRRASARLSRAYASVWDLWPALTLGVHEGGLSYEGSLIAQPGDSDAVLAGALWSGGVRTLTFSPGAEGSETVRFLAAVEESGALDPAGSDDLSTLLWDLDLESIAYTVQDDAITDPAPTPSTPRQGAADLSDRLAEEADWARSRDGIVDVQRFDSTLYFLDPAEIEYLKEGIADEYSQDLGRNVANLLLDVFEGQPDTDTRAEVLGVFERLLPHLLAQGSFGTAAYLLAEARELAGSADTLVPPQRRALGQLSVRLSTPGALRQLFYYLEDTPDPPTGDELGALLVQLHPEALSTVLRWSGGLTNRRSAAALGSAAAQFARERPRALETALGSDDPNVVLRALALAQRIRARDRVGLIRALAGHPEERVRVTVAEALGTLGGPGCTDALVRMLDDPLDGVRIAALRALGTPKHHRALPHVEKMMADRDLVDRDLAEQRALFDAYARIAEAQGIDMLQSIALGTRVWGRRSPEIRACAAWALGTVGTHTARLALQKAARDRHPVVRNAAVGALKRAIQT